MKNLIKTNSNPTHFLYYAICTLCMLATFVAIWVNHTNLPVYIIALAILIKLPFFFALTYVKDRENTALLAMCIGIWMAYEIIIITCINSMLVLFLLFGPIAISAKNGEDVLDYEAKTTPKNLVSIGILLHLAFIFGFIFSQGLTI